jgi:hypothetical protein
MVRIEKCKFPPIADQKPYADRGEEIARMVRAMAGQFGDVARHPAPTHRGRSKPGYPERSGQSVTSGQPAHERGQKFTKFSKFKKNETMINPGVS